MSGRRSLNVSHPFSWVRLHERNPEIGWNITLNESHLFSQVRPEELERVYGDAVGPSMKVTHSHGWRNGGGEVVVYHADPSMKVTCSHR